MGRRILEMKVLGTRKGGRPKRNWPDKAMEDMVKLEKNLALWRPRIGREQPKEEEEEEEEGEGDCKEKTIKL